jgi:5'(3')-deoxyribonucleotidase
MVSRSKPVVLLDVDGVLVNHDHLDKLNAEFGTSYVHSDIKFFGYDNMPVEHADFMMSCWDNPRLYDNDELTDEQLSVIEGLREIADVAVCTSPMPNSIESKYKFLLKYFDHNHIIMAGNKTYVTAGDILVDDGPHNITSFPGHVIVFDQPYNRHLKDRPRAMSFNEIGPLVVDYLLDRGLLEL